MRRLAVMLTLGALATSAVALGPATAPASASVPSTICGIAGKFSGILGTACGAVTSPGSLLSKGKQLLQGLLGAGGSTAAKVAGFAALGLWVAGGAKFAIEGVVKVLGATTSPDLGSTWFSGTYWRVVGIAALLTLPFLFAAAVQALLHSDLAMLLRAAFGYLPLAMLAIGIAAPLTTLLLSASDEMSSIVTAAAGGAAPASLTKLALIAASIKGAPFFGFLVAGLAAAGALVLWIELVVREAAVYVIVLMLPLAFAAMVWPARRVWAIRAIELLIALILSKFAIVAVIVLAGSAVGHLSGVSSAIAGIAMLLMAGFAPWAMLRLLPFAEVASAAAGTFGQQARGTASATADGRTQAHQSAVVAEDVTAQMLRDRDQVPDWADANGEAATMATSPGPDVERGADPIPAGVSASEPGAPSAAASDAGVPFAAAASEPGARSAAASEPGATASRPGPPSVSSNGGPPDPAESDERLPGFDPIWQWPNMTWRPTLDSEGRPQTPDEPPTDPPETPEDPPLLPPSPPGDTA